MEIRELRIVNEILESTRQLEEVVALQVDELHRLRMALDAERKYRQFVELYLAYCLGFISEGFSPQRRCGLCLRSRINNVISELKRFSFADHFVRARKNSKSVRASCLSVLEEAASLGHREARFDFSMTSSEPPDLKDMQRIADMGCASAQLWYGCNARNEDYLRMAVEQGLQCARRELGVLLCSKDDAQSVEEGISNLKMAADDGDELACEEYAKILSNQFGANENEAARYFRRAADEGDWSAKESYAKRLCNGDCIPRDLDEAARYFQLAADEGDWRAKTRYAERLYFGNCVPQNQNEAVRYFKLAADEGDAEAKECHAKSLYYGVFIRRDVQEAIHYFKLAADEGDGKAKELYAKRLSTGDFVPQNEVESARYLQLAADQMRGSPK